MKGIFIGSTTPRSGKSLLSFSLGLMLQQAGYNVGYMKPIGRIPKKLHDGVGDADALVVQEILGQNMPPDVLTPVLAPSNLLELAIFDSKPAEDALAAITAAYHTISEGKDIMLMAGTGAFPATGNFCNVDGLAMVRALRVSTLLVERFNAHTNYDALLRLKSLLGSSLLGVILNDVPEDAMRDTHKILVPYLAKKGIVVHAIIPRESRLMALRIDDLALGLGGYIAAGNAHASRMVEGFLIGTMQVDNFMIHLRQHQDSVVIIGGDRADLQLAALHVKVPCLILTGNLTPDRLVQKKAEELGIPLIVVKENTYAVARSMAFILKTKKIRELHQIRIGVELVKNNFSVETLLQSLDQLAH